MSNSNSSNNSGKRDEKKLTRREFLFDFAAAGSWIVSISVWPKTASAAGYYNMGLWRPNITTLIAASQVFTMVVGDGEGRVAASQVFSTVVGDGEGRVDASQVFSTVVGDGEGRIDASQVFSTVVGDGEGLVSTSHIFVTVVGA
jgi:hypothetical protein